MKNVVSEGPRRATASPKAAPGLQIQRSSISRTPDECRARIGVLEDEAREQLETVGYENGLATGRAECRRKHGRTPSAGFGGLPAQED